MDKKINLKVKLKRTNSGLILVDILLAMSLAVLFVVIITQSSGTSRDIFEYAKERNRLLDVYETHASEFEGMMPYESRAVSINADGWKYATTTISAYAHWYGNDRIQSDIIVRSYSQSLTLNGIRTFPFSNISDTAGTPLCSVDFSSKNAVGTYGFLQRFFGQSSAYSADSFSQPNPQTLNPVITAIALPSNLPLPMTDLQVRNGRAYISIDSTKASDPDVSMVDIQDPSHVQLIYSLNTGPGLAAISLAGNHIYAAMTSRTAQLQIIRISYLGGAFVESSYKLPLPYATATPALGSAIFYDKSLIYLGTEKWDGEEFAIIDVSNPAAPIKIGGYETDSKVGAIYVRDGIAYVTASDQQQIRVIDVHDPANLILLDSFSPSGWERQEGKSLSFFEDTLGWGRTSGGFNIKTDHELFRWGTSTVANFQSSNTGNPPHFPVNIPLSDPSSFHSTDISGGVYGIISDRSFVYVATKQLGKEFQIYDHNLSTTTMKSVSLPALPQTMTCDGDSLYVLAATAPVIYKISFK